MNKNIVLIQGELDIEINYLLSKMSNKVKKEISGFEFYLGNINDVNVVISKTLVGVVNSTMATTIGIMSFNPTFVINQGIAGAYSNDLHIGDIVIGKRCCNINAYKTPMLYEGEGSNPLNWELNKRAIDAKVTEESYTQIFRNEFNNVYENKVCIGTLGSGDIFNRERDRISWIREKFKCDCEDMESIGCYCVCEKFNIPCIGIRIISNNEILQEKIDKSVSINLQKLLEKIIHKIFI